jgi:hypothetical protein
VRRARAGAGGRAAAREHAKAPYSPVEIGGYLAGADAQPTVAGRMRASGLVCLGAGARLIRTVSAGEVVYLPRGNVRRFRNPDIQPAAPR